MSDIIKTESFTVTAIQGKPVSNATPNDGDTFVWSAADGYYKLTQPTSSSGGLTKVVFNEDGYWTCPEGVTVVIVSGSGGGSSGTVGGQYNEFSTAYGGSGGGSGEYRTYPVNVVPGYVYPITIGQGGISNGTIDTVVGGTTLFGDLFKAKGQQRLPGSAIGPFPVNTPNVTNDIGGYSAGISLGNEGDAIGGQAGTNGNGGNGGASNNPGDNAPANSGAGGGGGGGNNDDSGDGSGFPGGNGGSGYLHIIY